MCLWAFIAQFSNPVVTANRALQAARIDCVCCQGKTHADGSDRICRDSRTCELVVQTQRTREQDQFHKGEAPERKESVNLNMSEGRTDAFGSPGSERMQNCTRQGSPGRCIAS